MRQIFRLFALVAALGGSLRAESTVKFGPPAAWVKTEKLAQLPATPATDISYGYDFLLIDLQVAVREQATYSHRVYRVTSESSLQSASRLSLDFDPGYQQLTVHHLRVIRDGQVQDRLKTTPVKVIQQERDLDRHMLNGELTALWMMEDIRVGDVIDYAYTQRGWNPALERRYFGRIPTGWWAPVRRESFRLVTPLGRLPKTQSRGPGHGEPVHTREGDTEVLTWTAHDLAPINAEAETPDWFEPYPSIQLSEYSTWAQVVRWAEPLYALPEKPAEPISLQAAKLTQGITDEEGRALAILRFVQQEVRYLGMELGAGSYRPNAPEVVLSRRFGDCKDKTMLFCALARAAGVRAFPALVHTTYGSQVKSWLPTPHAFDHVIAAVVLSNGSLGWVDPTLTSQEGGLGTRGLPDYGSALIIFRGNTQFTAVTPSAGTLPRVHYFETILSPDFQQSARLAIHTIYSGLSADAIRRDFAESTPAEMSKSYLNYYTAVYPGLVAVEPPKLSDDTVHNLATVDVAYTIPRLWKMTDGRWKAEFYPKQIAHLAAMPDTTVRTSPLAISHPYLAKLKTTVMLPRAWTINARDLVMESDGFTGKSGIKLLHEGRTVEMTYEWSTKADHVTAPRVAQHVEALTKFREALGHTLTYRESTALPPPSAPAMARTNWLPVLVGLIALSVTVLGIRAVARRYPLQPPELENNRDPDLVGLRGWLVVLAFKVILLPLGTAGLIFVTFRQQFDLSVWEGFTMPGTAGYRPHAAAVILIELAGNMALLTISVWQIFLFFRRHRLFPRVCIILLLAGLAFMTTDYAVANQLWPMEAKAGQMVINGIGRVMIQAIIIIPYLLSSKRVRATFTR